MPSWSRQRNDKHLAILRECAQRHIHYSVEKPMATTSADAHQMASLARAANIKLMVNYWNAWVAPSPEPGSPRVGG